MSKLANLSKSFWGEAVNTGVYLVNGSPSVPLDFDIPQRVWTGKDVSYAHLKVLKHSCMYQMSKDRSLMIKQPCASSLDMEMRSSATCYGIQRRKK